MAWSLSAGLSPAGVVFSETLGVFTNKEAQLFRTRPPTTQQLDQMIQIQHWAIKSDSNNRPDIALGVRAAMTITIAIQATTLSTVLVKWKMIDWSQKPSKRMHAKPTSIRLVVLIASIIMYIVRLNGQAVQTLTQELINTTSIGGLDLKRHKCYPYQLPCTGLAGCSQRVRLLALAS